MKWEKKGFVYCANGGAEWMYQSAMLPTPLQLGDKLRIYVGFLTDQNVGRVGYVDVDPTNPSKIIKVSEFPVFDIGTKGSFDDNGVVPCTVFEHNGKIYMYYAGFQLGVNVPYYMFTGLAISENNGDTFVRYSKAPVLDRSDDELYARCGAFVLKDNGVFKMWYIGSKDEGWTWSNGKSKPLYNIKYLESEDGIHWNKDAVLCMDFSCEDEHGFGRPYVWKEDGIYKMICSVRTYSRGYYLGYAESVDGIEWQRKDKQVGIDLSESGWDNQNMSYPYVYTYQDRTYLFYNGNGCGKSGFGYAELAEA